MKILIKKIVIVIVLLCFFIATGKINAQNIKRKISFDKQYLNLPVQSDASWQVIDLIIEGDTVRSMDIKLADDKTDYWVYSDISMFNGKIGKIVLRDAKTTYRGFDLIYQDESFRDEATLYKERLRPQFHFTVDRGWSQDPVGLVYYDNEYHMFPLNSPYNTDGKNLHWGHAVSNDLIHWKELPIALYPDSLGAMWSGSVVIDHHNTSGFQKGDEKVMVAIYSASSQVQCLAYSNDRGRTWTKYENNPIIGDRSDIVGNEDVRDPRVFWHEESGKWVMVLFEGMGNSIFTSENLKNWNYQSHVYNSWECPELFELPVDNDPNNTKWVMYGAAGNYMIGNFDGEKFTMESGKHSYATGKFKSAFKHKGIFYASQTFNDEPNGRRIQLGWGILPAPGMPFNHMVTFPNELSLKTTDDGIRLFANPIREIKMLHKKKRILRDIKTTGNLLPKLDDELGNLLHIKAEFKLGPRHSYGVFGLRVNGFEVEYDARHNRLNHAFLDIKDRKIHVEILMDRTSVEVYGNHGRLYMADPHNTIDQPEQLELYNLWGEVHLSKLEVYELKSIWN